MSDSGFWNFGQIMSSLNGPQCVDFLENVFVPQAKAKFGHEAKIRFIQDNSSIHTSTEFFKKIV